LNRKSSNASTPDVNGIETCSVSTHARRPTAMKYGAPGYPMDFPPAALSAKTTLFQGF
jgi:hypothetical protein